MHGRARVARGRALELTAAPQKIPKALTWNLKFAGVASAHLLVTSGAGIAYVEVSTSTQGKFLEKWRRRSKDDVHAAGNQPLLARDSSVQPHVPWSTEAGG